LSLAWTPFSRPSTPSWTDMTYTRQVLFVIVISSLTAKPTFAPISSFLFLFFLWWSRDEQVTSGYIPHAPLSSRAQLSNLRQRDSRTRKKGPIRSATFFFFKERKKR
jgi:hypothetical protein